MVVIVIAIAHLKMVNVKSTKTANVVAVTTLKNAIVTATTTKKIALVVVVVNTPHLKKQLKWQKMLNNKTTALWADN